MLFFNRRALLERNYGKVGIVALSRHANKDSSLRRKRVGSLLFFGWLKREREKKKGGGEEMGYDIYQREFRETTYRNSRMLV